MLVERTSGSSSIRSAARGDQAKRAAGAKHLALAAELIGWFAAVGTAGRKGRSGNGFWRAASEPAS